MAWTFIEQLATERTPAGGYSYRMSVTDGTETRTEFYKSPVAMSGAELVTAKNTILFRLNNPPPAATRIKTAHDTIISILDGAGTPAQKGTAIRTYVDSWPGVD